MESTSSPKKKVSARDIILDISAGMSDAALMKKYKLSDKGLRSVFTKLLDKGFLSEKDFYSRPNQADGRLALTTTTAHDTVVMEDERDLLRLKPHVPIMVCGNNPAIQGVIQDISEKGVGIKGISACFGEIGTFVIEPEQYLPIDPIIFQAVCIWERHDEDGQCVAGFLFVHVTAEARKQLMKLLLLIEQESE
jgi:hypothetical protein